MPALANRKKYFTNGRLRIDFFQPSYRLAGNDAIMGDFGKRLIINELYILRFLGIAFLLILRRRYSAIASPLQCNRVAVTV